MDFMHLQGCRQTLAYIASGFKPELFLAFEMLHRIFPSVHWKKRAHCTSLRVLTIIGHNISSVLPIFSLSVTSSFIPVPNRRKGRDSPLIWYEVWRIQRIIIFTPTLQLYRIRVHIHTHSNAEVQLHTHTLTCQLISFTFGIYIVIESEGWSGHAV